MTQPLDGVLEATEGWFGPAEDTDDAGDSATGEMLAVVREHMAREVGFLVGRTAFEEMRGHWPAQTDELR